MTTRAEAIHLLDRLGFGPRPGDVSSLLEEGREHYVSRQLEGRTPEPEIDHELSSTPWIRAPIEEIVQEHQRQNYSLAVLERALTDLAIAKLIRAARSPNQLREVMVDFWFNHFNVYAHAWEPSLPAYEAKTIRPHALGKFRDLLGAVAKDPAMMFFLDTHTNVADRIENGKTIRGLNENFARELLELHTVGSDAGYSQDDIVDAARVLTGWRIAGWGDPKAPKGFEFRSSDHDWGVKEVFGLPIHPDGAAEGERLLDHLASHPKTAAFIASKLLIRFVSDEPSPSLVTEIASVFLQTEGDIRATLNAIFQSEEFNSDATKGSKFKNPFEYVVSCLRATRAELDYPEALLDYLSDMGMPLYKAKQPLGYPIRADEWLNPSSQVHRFRFALDLSARSIPGVTLPVLRSARPRTHQIGRSSSLADPNIIVELFETDLIGNRLSQRTATLARALAAERMLETHAKVFGLLLASPDFARR